MKQKIKNILLKLLMAWTMTISMADFLCAQKDPNDDTTFVYDRSLEKVFIVQNPVPQWIPPHSSYSFNSDRVYQFPPSRPVPPPVYHPTRPPTKQEEGLLYFHPEYLSAYASRLEVGSGASLEEMMSNRADLIKQGQAICNDKKGFRDNASGLFRNVERAHHQYEIDRLEKAIATLDEEHKSLKFEQVSSDFTDHATSYTQKKIEFDTLLADINNKLQDKIYSNESFKDLSTIYNELSSTLQKLKEEGPILGLNPETNPGYIATQQALDLSRLGMESLYGQVSSDFTDHATSYTQKKIEFDALLAEVNQKLQDKIYSNESFKDLSTIYNELLSTLQKLKEEGPILGLNPETNPGYIATQQALDLSRLGMESLYGQVSSDFTDHATSYTQKKIEFDTLLAEINKKLQDKIYSNESFKDLSTIYNELSYTLQKLKEEGPILGLDPETNPGYIATQQALDLAQSNLENLKQSFHTKYGEIIHFESDAPYLAQELTNFDGIFTGDEAPNMESFNNLLNSVLGKEDSLSSNEYTTDDSLPSDSFGNYAISSYHYVDDKFEVSMEIGTFKKFDSSEAPADWTDFNWEGMGANDNIMLLNGINYFEDTNEITFALSNNNERILIKGNRESFENYVIKKNFEQQYLLRPLPEIYPTCGHVNPDTLPISTTSGVSPSKLRSISSTIVDFLPYIGTGKAISELIFGHDYLSGEDVSRFVSAFAVVGSFVPIPGAAKAGKFAGKALSKVFRAVPNLTTPLGRAAIWRIHPLVRGIEIEHYLAKMDYKGWFRAGQLDNGKFPLIDFQKGNEVVSLKTVDTRSQGWFKRMSDHIEQLSKAEISVDGVDVIKRLDIRVQPGGLDMKKIDALEKFGERYEVEVIVTEFK